MTYEQLVEANKQIETIDFKGNDYAEVHERVRVFRMLFPEGEILTDILKDDKETCYMKATILDENGKVLATGHAFEDKKGYINATSYVENCETSAVGRALAFLGLGSKSSIASANEVIREDAEYQQAREAGPPKEFKPKNKTAVPEAQQSFKEQAKSAWKAMYPTAKINPTMIKVFGITEKTTEDDYKKILERIRTENLDAEIAKAEKEAN